MDINRFGNHIRSYGQLFIRRHKVIQSACSRTNIRVLPHRSNISQLVNNYSNANITNPPFKKKRYHDLFKQKLTLPSTIYKLALIYRKHANKVINSSHHKDFFRIAKLHNYYGLISNNINSTQTMNLFSKRAKKRHKNNIRRANRCNINNLIFDKTLQINHHLSQAKNLWNSIILVCSPQEIKQTSNWCEISLFNKFVTKDYLLKHRLVKYRKNTFKPSKFYYFHYLKSK
eukprot:333836_1